MFQIQLSGSFAVLLLVDRRVAVVHPVVGRRDRSRGEPNIRVQSVGAWTLTLELPQTHIAVHGPRGLGEAHRIYTPGDLQTVQNYEDKTNEAIMVLEANADVLSSLRMFYEKLAENIDFPLRGVCHEDIAAFATQVNDMIYDSRMQILRAELLLRITADRKGLVSESFFNRCLSSQFNVVVASFRKTERRAGPAAPSEPGDRENGKLDYQYAQNRSHVSERGNHNADHHRGDLDLSSSNIRIGELAALVSHLTNAESFEDILQYRCHQISESK